MCTFSFIVHHSSKVLNAKLGLVTVLRREVVGIMFVLGV